LRAAIVTAGLVAALLGGGLWWAVRRPPAGPPLEDRGDGFSVQASGPGRLIRFQAPQIPLRAFHWLAPLPGGILAAQVLTQNDRQRVAWFRDGAAQDPFLVLKPVGVADGFWRFAALREAAVAQGGTLLLLYQPGDPGSREASLALALDMASQQVRWFCRGGFSRMVLTPGQDAVYLYGGSSPILRLAVSQPSLHAAPTEIDLPPEIPEPDELLPTVASSFLVSHRNGLSAYRSTDGWTHFPPPAERGVECQNWKSSLTRAGKDIWWQAVPGRLLQVRADGHPALAWQGELAAGDPFAQDARLLRVLGADPAGSLWFTLAAPAPLPPAAPPPAPSAPEPAAALPPEGAPAAGVPEPAPDWTAYAAAGLDRLYRWNPARRTLERIALARAWAGLNPPPTVLPPVPGQGLAPAAGALLAEGANCAWWLPLDALVMEKVQMR